LIGGQQDVVIRAEAGEDNAAGRGGLFDFGLHAGGVRHQVHSGGNVLDGATGGKVERFRAAGAANLQDGRFADRAEGKVQLAARRLIHNVQRDADGGLRAEAGLIDLQVADGVEVDARGQEIERAVQEPLALEGRDLRDAVDGFQ
jgi:hypothetical protein